MVSHIRNRSPLSSARYIARYLLMGIRSYGNIKIIQYLETLEDRFQCGFLLWAEAWVKSRTNET